MNLISPSEHATRAVPALDAELSVALASVPGRAHVAVGRNNQDAVAARITPSLAMVVVADGCSSGRSSEVGARLASTWVALHVPRLVEGGLWGHELADAVEHGLLRALEAVVEAVAPDHGARTSVVGEMMLFSLLVGVVSGDRVLVLGAGDGVVMTPARTVVLDPGPDNAPAYLGYRLLSDPRATSNLPTTGGLEIQLDEPSQGGIPLLVGTDGLLPLLDCSSGGVVEVSAWLTDPRFGRNPSLLQKRLTVLAAQGSRLSDDVSCALLTAKLERFEKEAPCVS